MAPPAGVLFAVLLYAGLVVVLAARLLFRYALPVRVRKPLAWAGSSSS